MFQDPMDRPYGNWSKTFEVSRVYVASHTPDGYAKHSEEEPVSYIQKNQWNHQIYSGVFFLITKNDRAQCQVGQYLYTVASWAYKDKKGYHSKFQLILAILGPLIPKLCSDKSESGGNKSCFLLLMLEISQGETRIHFPPLWFTWVQFWNQWTKIT